VCCLRDESDNHYLDRVTVTAASGAERVLVIVWERASGVGVVWAKAMHEHLGIAAASGPAWSTTHVQLKRLGARLCTPAEKRLLAQSGVGTISRDVRVVNIDAACQWLRSVNEHTAAEQLEQHQQPQPQPAAAHHSSTAPQQAGAASVLQLHMPAIPNAPTTTPIAIPLVPQLQAGSTARRVLRA